MCLDAHSVDWWTVERQLLPACLVNRGRKVEIIERLSLRREFGSFRRRPIIVAVSHYRRPTPASESIVNY